jgi:DNA-binding NarL/FixJ family response regulator
MKISVIIADDHRILREGLAAVLKTHGIRVVGQASNGEEAILMARELKPDVILMDLEMPDVDGVIATRVIKQHMPAIKILMLSSFDENERVFEAMKMGASGYVVKRVSPEDLVKIIEACYNGEIFVSPYLANLALSESLGAQTQETQAVGQPCELLSSQEKRILELIVKGQSNKEIANAICLSPDTVKAHLKQIFEKLHVDNRTQAAVAAMERRLIHPA